MAAKVRCPQCEANLKMPEEHLGKTVRCPRCGVSFRSEAVEADDLYQLAEPEPAPSVPVRPGPSPLGPGSVVLPPRRRTAMPSKEAARDEEPES